VCSVVISYFVRNYLDTTLKRRRLSRLNKIDKQFREKLIRESFSFCGITADVFVLDSWISGYAPNFFVSRVVATNNEIPKAFVEEYATWYKHWIRKREAGEIFEGPKGYGVKSVRISRRGSAEEHFLYADLALSQGYVHQRAATSVFQNLSPETRTLLTTQPQDHMEPFFSNSFGVLLAVISSDNQLVFARRSRAVGPNQSKMICGVVEGINVSDFKHGSVSLFAAASRALDEELGVKLEPGAETAIKFNSIVFNQEYHEWNATGVVDLRALGPDYTSGKIIEYRTTAAAKDKFENRELLFETFEPEAVAGFLLSHEEELVNYARVVTILAMLTCFPHRKIIEDAITSVRNG
jgi:hypothetical protein